MKNAVLSVIPALFCISMLCGAHEFKGKKLIHAGWADGSSEQVRKYITLMEKSAPVYSGMRIFIYGVDENNKTIHHRMMFGPRKFKYEYFKKAVEDLKATKFTTLTDNFIATGVQPGKIDWFSDADWDGVCNNFALFARIAKETGMKGLIFDSEEYSGKFWWFKNVAGHTREECIAMARKRGRQFGKAVFGTFPECKLFAFFWLSLNSANVEHPDSVHLSAYFIDGVYDVLPPQARIYDGMENQGYRLRDLNDVHRAVKMFYQDFPKMLSPENRGKYFNQTRMAMSIYLDAYFSLDPSKSYAYWLADGKKKYGTAGFFRRNLQLTMQAADEYAWTWGERGTWWKFPNSSRKTWESFDPEARQALYDALSPIAAAERVVKTQKRPNLLTNASLKELNYKKIPAGWTVIQNSRLSHGTLEFPKDKGQVVFRGTYAASLYQRVEVTPGKEYFLTAKGSLKSAASSPGARLKLEIDFRNAKGELTGFNRRRSTVFRPDGKDGELKGALLFDVPDDATGLLVFLKAENLEKDASAVIYEPALYERNSCVHDKSNHNLHKGNDMNKNVCTAMLAAGALTLQSAELMMNENFERGVWRVDASWRGKTSLTAEQPRSGRKAMLLTSVDGIGKCGNTRGDYLLGTYEYTLYASGTGTLQLGVIRYDWKDGKLLIREDKQKVVTPLSPDYQKIVFPFEIKKPNPSKIMLTITVRGKDSFARIDDLTLVRLKTPEPDFSDLKSAPSMQQAAAKIKASAPVNILFIGDSLTDFYRGGNHLDMVNYFLKKNGSGVTFHNYACRGDFITRVVDRFNQAPKVPFRNHYKGIWDRNYDAAFVLLGANDSVLRLESGKMAVPPEEVEKKYRELFEIFKKHGIRKVVLVSPASSYYPACRANRKKQIAAKKGGLFGVPENIEAFASVMKKLSSEFQFPYLDIYTPMKAMPEKASLFNSGDGVHLTPAGHEFVALKELEFLAGSGLVK